MADPTPSDVASRAVRFNSNRECDHPKFHRLVDRLTPMVIRANDRVQGHARTRAVSKRLTASVRRSVQSLLLDLYAHHQAHPDLVVGITLRTGEYSKVVGHGRRSWLHPDLSHQAFRMTFEWMERHRLLTIVEKGKKPNPDQPGVCTTIRACPRLVRLMNEILKVPEISIRDTTERGLIILKDAKKQPIEFKETDDTRRMADNLRLINKAIAAYLIDIEISDDETAKLADRMHREKGRNPFDVTAKTLVRIFNNGSFDQGGRFYGGWWQGVPSKCRRFIRVNGKLTVEVDYSAFHPSILYALEGQKLRSDAYDIGLPNREQTRPWLKVAFNGLLNAKSLKINAPSEFDERVAGCSWDDVLKRVLKKHSCVKYRFGTGYGLRLQRIDSDMAEKVLLYFAKMNVACLPIHDSFIVHSGYEGELVDVMKYAYESVIRKVTRNWWAKCADPKIDVGRLAFDGESETSGDERFVPEPNTVEHVLEALAREESRYSRYTANKAWWERSRK